MATQQMNVKDIEKLFEAGLHLGHKKNRLHPKAKRFVYRIENGVSIIDLTQTAVQLEKAVQAVQEAGAAGKKMLVVATKKVASTYAREAAQAAGVSFITTKWLPGLLTNFETIIKNVQKLKELKEMIAGESYANLVKHEKVKLSKKMSRLQKFYDGLLELSAKPDLLFIVDIRKEKNAVMEAGQTGTQTVAIVDTNCNPDTIGFPVVANDDSPESVQFVVSQIIEAYGKGKTQAAALAEKEAKKAEKKQAAEAAAAASSEAAS